ncbi:MAG: glycosyltransferase, partial [Sarcina sp.]
MLGVKFGYKMPKELTDKVIVNGYDNLSDSEKVELTKLMLKCYPEISKSMYQGFNVENKKEFIDEVVEGKFYDRYKELSKAIDSTFNSIIFSAQYSAFKEYFEELFSKKYDAIVVFHASFGWNIDLKQRPQHLAEAISDENILYIYRADVHQDKDVFAIEKVKENLYLVNLDMYSLNVAFFEALQNVKKPKFVHVYATCLYDVPYDKIKSYMKKDFKVIYDFVDEISSDISGVEVSNQMIEDHNKLLTDTENVLIVSTAKKLKKLAEEVRGSNINSILAPNAVNIKDFHTGGCVEVPSKMKKIISKGKPIVGYYGALASWFDYNKIMKLAKERPEYEIVLIGINYDKTYDKSGLDY